MKNDGISVVITELDSGIPCMVICSDFHIPLTSYSFVLSLYNTLHDDKVFNINKVNGCGVSFKSSDYEEVEIYFKKMLVGSTHIDDLKTASNEALRIFKALREQSNG